MQISKHFKLSEFTKSQIAARHGLKNLPGSGEIKNLENVCYEILEPVRAKFDRPILITSGFRSLEVNRKLGSSDSSQHCKGQAVDFAVDFEIPGVANIKVAYWLQANVDFDQCILEYHQPDDDQHGWIHVSYNEKGANRKKVLTFDGKTYQDGLPDIKYQQGEIIN